MRKTVMPTKTDGSLSSGNSTEKVDPDGLLPHETVWVAKQPFLASKGYHLRPRFQPNWVPSWVKDPTLIRGLCEDRIELPVCVRRLILEKY